VVANWKDKKFYFKIALLSNSKLVCVQAFNQLNVPFKMLCMIQARKSQLLGKEATVRFWNWNKQSFATSLIQRPAWSSSTPCPWLKSWLCPIKACYMKLKAKPGKPYWRGKISTVDFLVQTSLDQLLFLLELCFPSLHNNLS